jgi:hypothetical protein
MELEAEDKTGKISLEVIFLTYISGKHRMPEHSHQQNA